MNWYGLDWTGILINIFLGVVCSGLVAAYGGHLAAEAVTEPKRRRKIKVYFWSIFIVGSFVTIWQQIRSGVSDLDHETKDQWAQALAISKFPAPAAPIFQIRQVPTPPRTFLELQMPIFPQMILNGEKQPARMFQPGEELFFNVDYSVRGTNPIELLETAKWLKVAPDFEEHTQEAVLAEFKQQVAKERKTLKPSTQSQHPTLFPNKPLYCLVPGHGLQSVPTHPLHFLLTGNPALDYGRALDSQVDLADQGGAVIHLQALF